ncbi:MAG: hypothetical protein HKN33_00550 [Pyrinomonadaceae bacterium]|nr:hypothetical protein [Pyrinomonadaceae bacterium]
MNPGESNIEPEFTMERGGREVPEDPPFAILVVGDFTGSNSKVLRTKEIDRDDFESVLKSYGIEMRIGEAKELAVSLNSLDSFHPDELFKSLDVFEELRGLRRDLLDEDTFSRAASLVRSWFDDEPVEIPEEPVEIEDGGELLDDILSSVSRDRDAYKPTERSFVQEFVKEVVDPHLIRVDETAQAELVRAVDEATGDIMRSILSDKRFRALESNWRGLYLMCRRIETATDLKIHVLDMSKERFLEEIKNEESDLVRALVAGPGSDAKDPWALVAAAFDFDMNVEDVAGLIRAGTVNGTSSTPFVSHVRPSMLGIDSFADAPDYSGWDVKSDTGESRLWNALRNHEDANSIGFVTPRILSRLPYGAGTDPTETFDFEEAKESQEHDDYLWMNPVFGFSIAVAASYRKHGWEIAGRYELDIEGLPIHVYKSGGETVTKPCAEIEMTDAGLEFLLEQGLMPLASFKNSDRVRLGGIQSASSPRKPLRSRWS